MPLLLPLLLFAAATAPYDLVIRNGHVIDGTGSPWYAADLGIRAGKIAAIGNLSGAPSRRTLDARGMVVARRPSAAPRAVRPRSPRARCRRTGVPNPPC